MQILFTRFKVSLRGFYKSFTSNKQCNLCVYVIFHKTIPIVRGIGTCTYSLKDFCMQREANLFSCNRGYGCGIGGDAPTYLLSWRNNSSVGKGWISTQWGRRMTAQWYTMGERDDCTMTREMSYGRTRSNTHHNATKEGGVAFVCEGLSFLCECVEMQ
jgi:hypothetical protein